MPFNHFSHQPYCTTHHSDFSPESPLINSLETPPEFQTGQRLPRQDMCHQRGYRRPDSRRTSTPNASSGAEFLMMSSSLEEAPLSLSSSMRGPQNEVCVVRSSRRRFSSSFDSKRFSREFAGPLAQPKPQLNQYTSSASPNPSVSPCGSELTFLSTTPSENHASSVRTISEDQASISDHATSVRTARSECYAVHTALESHCEFILLPPSGSLPQPTTGTKTDFSVFFGQLRFSTSPAQLTWLIAYLTDSTCTPLKTRRSGQGCFTVSFATSEEQARVLQLQDRLLFDAAGVWYARGEEGKQRLHQYAEDSMAYFAVQAGLPKSTVVVRGNRVAVARSITT